MAERIRPAARFQNLLISDLVFTDTQLGVGSDATVYEVNWRGTVCAAKRIHDILLQDQSPGGAEKLISKFEAECLTWSELRHPGVVQFLGVHLERNSRLPVLVIEKMDTSLRKYCDGNGKKEFPLHLKAFVLRQICQALAYLHGQNPPLVHHDLSPNNVLLNMVSFVTKLTDFGMSRAINPSTLSRKSSIKGTPAFMSPEALHDPPRYNETLDVFSFGNIILSTLTHEWPNPGPPTRYKGDKIVGLTELQRRERYAEMFTPQERQLFLPTVRQCLENRPDKRPSSAVLVRELRRIESSLPSGSHIPAAIDQLYQQLPAKEEECGEKNEELLRRAEALKEKDEALREKESDIAQLTDALTKKDLRIFEMSEEQDEKDKLINELSESVQQHEKQLSAKKEECRQKDEALREKDEALKDKDDLLKEKDATIRELQEAVEEQRSSIQAQHTANQTQQDTIQAQQAGIEQLRKQPAVAEQVKHPPRDWRKHEVCRKVIQHSPEGGLYYAIAVNSKGLLAVTDVRNRCVHLLTSNGTLVRSIRKGELSDGLFGVSFDLKGNVWVADYHNNTVAKLSQDGRLLSESDCSNHPRGVSVSANGLIYICDEGNRRITVHNEKSKFLFAFVSRRSGPGCFDRPCDIAFGSDGFMYVVDRGNECVIVLSNRGTFKRQFKPKYSPLHITSTTDDNLLITSYSSHTIMVYTLEGELIHQFGAQGSDPGRFILPYGICVDDNELVYVVDRGNKRVQVFELLS